MGTVEGGWNGNGVEYSCVSMADKELKQVNKGICLEWSRCVEKEESR